MNDRALLIGHAAVTWTLVGLAWTILVVQYPLFAKVDAASFHLFHAEHSARITWIVFPAMVAELALAGLFVIRPVDAAGRVEAVAGLAAAMAIWGVTALWSVPMHERLGDGFSSEAHRSLMWSHLARTVLWSARGIVASVWLWRA